MRSAWPTVRRETALDRCGKALRVNRELRSGDAIFDREIYLEADVPEATLAPLFASPDVRRRLLDLLRTGHFDAIKLTPDAELLFSVPSPQFVRGRMVRRSRRRTRALGRPRDGAAGSTGRAPGGRVP